MHRVVIGQHGLQRAGVVGDVLPNREVHRKAPNILDENDLRLHDLDQTTILGEQLVPWVVMLPAAGR